MDTKIILGVLFSLLATISQAQDREFIKPNFPEPKSYTEWLPELQVDTVFIDSLNRVLLDRSIYDYSITHRTQRHFFIQFKEIDSLQYAIQVSLWSTPASNSIGFFEHKNGSFYWFSSNRGFTPPPGIIFGSKSRRKFSWIEDIFISEVPLWFFVYNIESGSFEKAEDKYELFE